MAQTGFTPIVTYNTATATTVPSAANLAQGELAVNVTDKKLYTKDSGGNVILIASNGGDVTGPATATDNAIARFDATTGRLIQNSAVTIADTTGNMTGVGDLTTTGNTILGNASTDTLNVGNGDLVKDASGNVGVGVNNPLIKFDISAGGSTTLFAQGLQSDYSGVNGFLDIISSGRSGGRNGALRFFTGNSSTGTERMRIPALGGVQAVTTISVGNATPSASGAGITFPATQSASTDANTLDDYEEGTWTPNQGAGLTVVGAFSSAGTYTKVGRLVTVQGYVQGATSVAQTVATITSSNLPFTASAIYGFGGGTNNPFTTTAVFAANISSTSLYSVTAIPASTAIHFSCTYYV